MRHVIDFWLCELACGVVLKGDAEVDQPNIIEAQLFGPTLCVNTVSANG